MLNDFAGSVGLALVTCTILKLIEHGTERTSLGQMLQQSLGFTFCYVLQSLK
jgi:hypothetical protein